MYAFKYYLFFVGVIVAAFQSEKAAKYARKPIPRFPTKDAPRLEKTSLFLNNKTTSTYFYYLRMLGTPLM
jgi:carboxypeptidase D